MEGTTSNLQSSSHFNFFSSELSNLEERNLWACSNLGCIACITNANYHYCSSNNKNGLCCTLTDKRPLCTKTSTNCSESFTANTPNQYLICEYNQTKCGTLPHVNATNAQYDYRFGKNFIISNTNPTTVTADNSLSNNDVCVWIVTNNYQYTKMGIQISNINFMDLYVFQGGMTYTASKTYNIYQNAQILNFSSTSPSNYFYIVAKARNNGATVTLTVQSIGTEQQVPPPPPIINPASSSSSSSSNGGTTSSSSSKGGTTSSSSSKGGTTSSSSSKGGTTSSSSSGTTSSSSSGTSTTSSSSSSTASSSSNSQGSSSSDSSSSSSSNNSSVNTTTPGVQESSTNLPLIIGASVGGVGFVGFLSVFIYFMVKKMKRSQNRGEKYEETQKLNKKKQQSDGKKKGKTAQEDDDDDDDEDDEDSDEEIKRDDRSSKPQNKSISKDMPVYPAEKLQTNLLQMPPMTQLPPGIQNTGGVPGNQMFQGFSNLPPVQAFPPSATPGGPNSLPPLAGMNKAGAVAGFQQFPMSETGGLDFQKPQVNKNENPKQDKPKEEKKMENTMRSTKRKGKKKKKSKKQEKSKKQQEEQEEEEDES